MKWKTLESEYLTTHRYFTSRRDRCETEDGKIIPEYFVVELPPSVCAVCLTDDNEVLVVKQYRHPVNEVCIELPGGFVDKDETPEAAVRRELQEETAHEFDTITSLGKIAANPGVLNNFTYLFLATGGKPKGKQKLDEHEFLDVQKITIDELKRLLNENRIVQSLHACCIYYALKELGKL